jgi:hypothetical protein
MFVCSGRGKVMLEDTAGFKGSKIQGFEGKIEACGLDPSVSASVCDIPVTIIMVRWWLRGDNELRRKTRMQEVKHSRVQEEGSMDRPGMVGETGIEPVTSCL